MRASCGVRTSVVLAAVLSLCYGTHAQDDKSQQTPASVEAGQNQPSPLVKIGGDVTAPRVILNPDPEYSPEARKAGYQGVCVLWLVVGEDGTPRDIRVARRLGMGLDEKAIEAVRTWRFEPARRNGKPVAVQVNVEVNFHLYFQGESKVQRLSHKASAGDVKAQLEFAKLLFQGREIARNDEYGGQLLLRAANQGLKGAQFLAGQRAFTPPVGDPDYVTAYMWFTLARRGGEKKSDKPLKELASKMSPEQLAEAQQRIDNWKPTPSK